LWLLKYLCTLLILKTLSPANTLFLRLYLLLTLLLLSTPTFFSSWLFIEFIILIFLGLSYSTFQNSLSNLITFFLIQTLASLSIFISFTLNLSILLSISVLLKLSMFPVHIWFMSVAYRFPTLILFLISTIHKLPVFYIISTFVYFDNFTLHLLFFSIVISLLVSGLTICTISDSRLLLVTSSIGNNTWFLLSRIVSLSFFLIFLAIYTIFLYSTFSTFSYQSNPIPNKSYLFSLNIVLLSALPPSPLFFLKLYLLYLIITMFETPVTNSFFIPILLSASTILVSYLRHIFKLLTNSYNRIPQILLLKL